MRSDTEVRIERIRRAYDLTVEQFERGIDPLAEVPDDLKTAPGFQALVAEASEWCNVGARDVREYFAPKRGMRFLDVGCAAGLLTHRLFEWPSTYFGVDISPALVGAMRAFVAEEGLDIGGLDIADAANLPFEERFFDIAAVIGVLEYHTFDYIRATLAELHRVLKVGAGLVLDIPNLAHPHVELMFRLEDCLRRPLVAHDNLAFEAALDDLFLVERVDTSRVMLKYFCRATN